MQTVVIDPGHGGWDPGALAVDGRPEKEITLPLGLAVRDALLAGWNVRVLLTRETDAALAPAGEDDLELRRRAAVANDSEAALLLSLHADAGLPATRGASLFCWTDKLGPPPQRGLRWLEARGNHTDPRSFPLAEQLQLGWQEALQALGIPWHGWAIWCANLGVLRYTEGPALLLEVGFQTNGEDLRAIRQPGFNEMLGQAIAAGVAATLGLPAKTWTLPRCLIRLPGGAEVWGEVQNGRAMVPVRELFEALGRQVHWIDAPPTVDVK